MELVEAMGHLARIISFGLIGAGIAVLTGSFTAIGQGNIAAKAIESIARQPESKGDINSSMFIGLAMAETGGIYGLLISIIMVFVVVNPLIDQFRALLATIG
jgi:F-type H+-transporting ATPase subunit c